MISNKEDKKLIKAVLILEIIGKPADYLTTTLEDIIKKIGEEQGVQIIEKKIKEPIEMEKKKGFFTSFAEVEVDVEDILYLAILMFRYMPSHIEVVSPEEVTLTNRGWSDIFSELVRKLHSYDEVVAVLQMEKKILENKLREVLGKKKAETETKEGEEQKKTEKKTKEK